VYLNINNNNNNNNNMGKSTTTLCLDEGLIKSLKAQDINISKLVNEFLTNFINQTPQELKLKEIEKRILNSEAQLALLKDNKEKIIKRNVEIEKEKGVPFKIGN
jgi:uncharacterized protein YijF (DUF1287 family)